MSYVTDAAREYAKKKAKDSSLQDLIEYVFSAPTFEASAISSFILNDLNVDDFDEYKEYVNMMLDEIKNADNDTSNKHYNEYMQNRQKIIDLVNKGLKEVAKKNNLDKYCQIDNKLKKSIIKDSCTKDTDMHDVDLIDSFIHMIDAFDELHHDELVKIFKQHDVDEYTGPTIGSKVLEAYSKIIKGE